VVTTAINSLNTLSRTSRRPAIASIFLLNNISYLRHHLLLDPAHPDLFSLLSKPTQDALNSNFRTAKAAYFDSNFSPLMQALTDDLKERMNKAATKEKFTRFFDLLEEVMERHKMAKVMEDDPEGRETIGDEVVKLVIPSLQRFTQKHRDKEFSKSKQCISRMILEAHVCRLPDPQKCMFLARLPPNNQLTFTLDIKMSADAVETQLKGIFR
jgi:exocyst complex protein 7